MIIQSLQERITPQNSVIQIIWQKSVSRNRKSSRYQLCYRRHIEFYTEFSKSLFLLRNIQYNFQNPLATHCIFTHRLLPTSALFYFPLIFLFSFKDPPQNFTFPFNQFILFYLSPLIRFFKPLLSFIHIFFTNIRIYTKQFFKFTSY